MLVRDRSIADSAFDDESQSRVYFRRTWITHLVSTQAVSNPKATAVADGDSLLTYRDLDAQANQLAEHLRTLGVSPNVVVGLCLARSKAMAVGALGILKAGGAYLALDPACPPARLAFQLADAKVPVLVTSRCVNERLARGTWQVVQLDPQGRLISKAGGLDIAEPPDVELQETDLAYVIYTSGSTGQPKGVEITHAGLQNLVSWHQQAFSVTAADRATLQASPGFDAAVWEMWPYLAAGASLHLPDDDTRSNPEDFRDWLVEYAISIAFVPTPMAERLIQLEWPSKTALRVLLTGADTLRHYPPSTLPFVLVNNYGPTECTVVTTSGIVPPDNRQHQLPSIGRPITNVKVYILDNNMRQLPAGSPGELYVGGVSLARGYRNRPELTAERFVPDPFGRKAGSRLYRTGDRACYLPDGQIAFLGRIDDQVKIRGYRIEPAEIATVLDRHPSVQASVVVAAEDSQGQKQLIAYVVPQKDAPLTAKMLREFLLSGLPDYMVPAAFYRVERLPLSASGKTDRRALPPPEQAQLLDEPEHVAPRTPVEERMTHIVAKLLNLERVGISDNFFILGGNSLLGAQVIARVRDAFNVDLPLLSLFNHPTVAELSSEIEQLLIDRITMMGDEEAWQLADSLSKADPL